MKQLRLILFVTILLICVPLVQGGFLSGLVVIPLDNIFTRTITADAITSNWVTFSHPLLNDNDAAIVFATPLYQVPGTTVFNEFNQPFGVWYNAGRWTVYNQGSAISMSPFVDASFMLQVQGLSPNVFRHTTSAGNVSADATYLNHPLTNSAPSAMVFVTPTYFSGATTYNNQNIGVFYDTTGARWGIYNQSGAAMPVGTGFNVQVLSADSYTYLHTVNSGNRRAGTQDHITNLNHFALNNNPRARFTVTQRYNPTGTVRNTNAIGTWYDASAGVWTIFNQDSDQLPLNALFNINILEDDGDPIIQGLQNGSFEVESGIDNSSFVPQGWFASNTAQGRRVCNAYGAAINVAYSGDCALQMTGAPSVSATFAQTYRPPVNRRTVSLGAIVSGTNQTGGATIFARVFLADGTRGLVRLSSTDLNAGTYAWKYVSGERTFTSDVVRVRVSIVTQDPTGTFRVDNVRLMAIGLLRSEPAAPLIPMPDSLPVPGMLAIPPLDDAPAVNRAPGEG
ncbi:MAG: hypothetical protein MUF87_20285 [Anaerolineae bacterium]|jgi:hypothetical protein|nr:hypothetical protein [Anaerolineae bacterium]